MKISMRSVLEDIERTGGEISVRGKQTVSGELAKRMTARTREREIKKALEQLQIEGYIQWKNHERVVITEAALKLRRPSDDEISFSNSSLALDLEVDTSVPGSRVALPDEPADTTPTWTRLANALADEEPSFERIRRQDHQLGAPPRTRPKPDRRRNNDDPMAEFWSTQHAKERRSTSALTTQLEDANRQLRDARRIATQLRHQVAQLQETIDGFPAEKAGLEQKIQELEALITALTLQVDDLTAANYRDQGLKRHADEQVRVAIELLKDAEANIRRLERELQEALEQLPVAALHAEIAQLQADKKALEAKNARLTTELTKTQGWLAEEQDANRKMGRDVRMSLREIRRLEELASLKSTRLDELTELIGTGKKLVENQRLSCGDLVTVTVSAEHEPGKRSGRSTHNRICYRLVVLEKKPTALSPTDWTDPAIQPTMTWTDPAIQPTANRPSRRDRRKPRKRR